MFHFRREEEIQARPDDRDRAEFADLIPGRRDSGAEYVGAEFELQCEREIARQDQTDGGKLGWLFSCQRADELHNRDTNADRDQSGAETFDGEFQPLHENDDAAFDGVCGR